MVGVFYIRVDLCIRNHAFQRISNIDIIDTPAFVLRPDSWKTLAPPAVPVRFGMKLPETVTPAVINEFCHPFSFLW